MQLVKQFKQYPTAARIFDQLHIQKNAAFLDSSLPGALGRYSIIGVHPYLTLKKEASDKTECFTINGIVSNESFESYVSRYLKEHREENETGLPISSGAIGYFSYDYGRKKQGVSTRHPETVCIPDSILVFYDGFFVEDHETHTMYVVSNSHDWDCERGMEEMLQILKSAEQKSEDTDGSYICTSPETLGQSSALEETSVHKPGSFTANFMKEDYKNAVQRMIDYIIEGDIYIANMTQQLTIQSTIQPYDMFCRLRKCNPAPFGGYFNYDGFQIICASPERFLQMQNGIIQTRPIKGTRKRGKTPQEDEALRLELEQSEKDKSELLMIVDLERNDLNRVCIPGSVRVTELFKVETYATVFHLISNIIGQLRPELTVMELLEAAFPGGSITGAPKLRAMEIIDELEHGQRNLYTGSIGYISLDGGCDFNIVIRTALHQNDVYYLGVGGGITCESELEFEYEETLLKAKALLNACDIHTHEE